ASARLGASWSGEPQVRRASVMIDLGTPAEAAQPITAYRGVGCQSCGGTGFRGRTALYEAMRVTEEVKHLVLGGAPATELKRQAIADGMTTLRMSGVDKIRE